MARKAVVDKEVILELLKNGETTQRIAERYNVSRQAIDLHRKEFIRQGLLPDRRAPRVKKQIAGDMFSRPEISQNASIDRSQPELIVEKREKYETTSSLDAQIDLIISAFSALKRIPVIEKELERYRKENEKVRNEIERMKEREKKRIDQENRWMLIGDQDGNGN